MIDELYEKRKLVNSLIVLNHFLIQQWKTESKLSIVKSYINDDFVVSPKSNAQFSSTSKKSKYFENKMEDSDDRILSEIENEQRSYGNNFSQIQFCKH